MSNENEDHKQYYDVIVEGKIPIIFMWKILASSPEEAYQISKKRAPHDKKYSMSSFLEHKIVVLLSGTSLVKYIKNIVR